MGVPTNRELKTYLLDTVALSDLEALLAKELAVRTQLPPQREVYGFDDLLWGAPYRTMGRRIEPAMQTAVNTFLKIKAPEPCTIKYITSFGDILRGGLPAAAIYSTIYFPSLFDGQFSLPAMASGITSMLLIAAVYKDHELAHYAQDQNIGTFSMLFTSRAFLEGHACGVEHYISQQLAAGLEDMEYLRFATNRRISALSNTSRWLAQQRATPMPQFAIDTSVYEGGVHRDKRKPCSYCLGTTVFALAEQRHGLDVYAHALKRPSIIVE